VAEKAKFCARERTWLEMKIWLNENMVDGGHNACVDSGDAAFDIFALKFVD
jgi:hypothetical protein